MDCLLLDLAPEQEGLVVDVEAAESFCEAGVVLAALGAELHALGLELWCGRGGGIIAGLLVRGRRREGGVGRLLGEAGGRVGRVRVLSPAGHLATLDLELLGATLELLLGLVLLVL